MKLRLRRILVCGLVVLFGALLLVAARFLSWRSELSENLRANSRVVATKLGPIEYAVAGDGLPFLSLHGTPGGYDVALTSRRSNPNSAGTKTISVSRPGYLQTPLSSGDTFERQADLFAALLDELRIDRVVVVASSGGGYAGLQFALRHPGRCIGLVMLAPAIGHEELPEGALEANAFNFFLEDFSMWALADMAGPMFMKDFDENDPGEAAFAKALSTIRSPAALRFAGRRNDLLQRANPAVDHWSLESIVVPTLIIHGDADENADYELSVKAAARIPRAKLVTVEGGDHYFPITRREVVDNAIGEFLRSIEASAPKGPGAI
jgi:pimeloyl-ACP methyl ester carboxylesterase